MVIIAVSYTFETSWSVKPENSALIVDAQDAYDFVSRGETNEIDMIFVVDDYGRCKEYGEGDYEWNDDECDDDVCDDEGDDE